MAPSSSDLASIKDLITQLQTRVEQMERDFKAGAGGTPAEELRMILMGPPGAGQWGRFIPLPCFPCPLPLPPLQEPRCNFNFQTPMRNSPLITDAGKGTQAPKIKEKFCICHLVRSIFIFIFIKPSFREAHSVDYNIGYRGYASISGCEKNSLRAWGQEDHGSGGPCEWRNHGQHDQEWAWEQLYV